MASGKEKFFASFRSKIVTSVQLQISLVIDDKVFIYGVHGRQEHHMELSCIESTGKLKWSKGHLGTGNHVRVGNKHLSLWELGELLVFQALTTPFKSLYRQQVLGRGRAHFAFSENILFIRDDLRLTGLKLK